MKDNEVLGIRGCEELVQEVYELENSGQPVSIISLKATSIGNDCAPILSVLLELPLKIDLRGNPLFTKKGADVLSQIVIHRRISKQFYGDFIVDKLEPARSSHFLSHFLF